MISSLGKSLKCSLECCRIGQKVMIITTPCVHWVSLHKTKSQISGISTLTLIQYFHPWQQSACIIGNLYPSVGHSFSDSNHFCCCCLLCRQSLQLYQRFGRSCKPATRSQSKKYQNFYISKWSLPNLFKSSHMLKVKKGKLKLARVQRSLWRSLAWL